MLRRSRFKSAPRGALAHGNVGRRALAESPRRVRLELVKEAGLREGGSRLSDQSGLDLIQLESLILAQNERWRQA
jgi:hypothetical protein